MRRFLTASLLFGLLVVVPTPNLAQSDSRTSRLVALGKVWLTVKFAHPRVALTERDWDAALVAAWPRLKAANDDAEFANAVGALLGSIGDPVTRVEHGAPLRPMPRPPAITRLGSPADHVLVLDLREAALADPMAWARLVESNGPALQSASRLVVDLRGSAGAIGAASSFEAVTALLVSTSTTLPSSRAVMHSGYRAVNGAPFYSSQHTVAAALVVKPRPDYVRRNVVFLVDEKSFVPPIALALQAAGTGVIASATGQPYTPVGVRWIALSGEYRAVVRVEDLVLAGKRAEVKIDVALEADHDDMVTWRRALGTLEAPRSAWTGLDDPAPVFQPDLNYADSPYPAEPYRFIAAMRLWGVFDYFFPYKHLLEAPWESVLPEFLPKTIDAGDELAYVRVLAQLAARSRDSHVVLSGSRAFAGFLGEFQTPLSVRYVESRPVVTRVHGDPIPGIAVGDEIVSVDGEAVAIRAKRIEDHTAFSTPAGRDRAIVARLLNGAASSTAKLVVRGADGKDRETMVQRLARAETRTQRDGDVYRVLEGNIGYADLERLNVADVPPMFEQFANTSGIIFDMRGYPRGTAWSIAPRINTLRSTAAALFYRPLLVGASTFEQISFLQPLPPTITSVVRVPTVMLIDERAISQSEHTGLFLKAANGTTFIGSQTTGANGDVTAVVLPGGLRVTFTGHDVRWPDGRQLQRVGLVPDIEVKPTIAGIRAGRDELLERAVAFVQSNQR